MHKAKAKQIKFPPMFGVSNYHPEQDAAEDTETIKRQIKWMQIECEKKRPDYKGVGDRMHNTFADRRHQMVEEGFATPQLLKAEYPWLFWPEPDEVCTLTLRTRAIALAYFIIVM